MITTDEKGISVRRLKTFLTNLKNIFASKDHTHTTVNGHTVESNVPENAVFTDTKYSKLSEFTDDVGYVKNTDSRLSDSRNAKDVSAWAKASTKPSYTKSEIGLGNVDNTADANKSVKYAISAGSATNLSGFVSNNSGFWGIVNEIPKAGKCINRMDTPNGGGIAFSEHDSIVDQIIDGKYYQDEGKYMCLDTNNYSFYAASKNHSHTTVNGHTVNSDVPANAKFTDTTYSDATTSVRGLMTTSMVTKLNGITSGANTKYKQITQKEYTALGSNYEKGTVYFINN